MAAGIDDQAGALVRYRLECTTTLWSAVTGRRRCRSLLHTDRLRHVAGKEVREIDGRHYVFGYPIHADVAPVSALVGDPMGSLS